MDLQRNKNQVATIDKKIKVLIIRMDQVPLIDQSDFIL
jgi:SulP family sulfate permease